MTERQGGSDVRANETTARPHGDAWLLDGHKWFCSAPMSDAFLVLAQAPGRPLLLPARAATAGIPDRAAEGQARQPLQCLGGDRARGRGRAARRRGGPRRADDPRDGRAHPARLRARLDGADAACGRGGNAPRGAPLGLRRAARRPAADAERAGRPLRRVGGGDGDGAAAGARVRRGRRLRSVGWPPRSPSSGSASARRRSSRRRSSASAATGTSRSRSCHGSSARARSTRSGRAPGTSTHSTFSAHSTASPRRLRRFWPRCASPPELTRGSTRRSGGSRRPRRAEGGGRAPAAGAARGRAAGIAARPARRARGGRRVLRAPRGARRRLRHAPVHLELGAIVARSTPHLSG